MRVRGVAFLARRQTIIASQGEGAWRSFLEDFAKREPVFAQPVLPISQIPIESFLALNDALIDRFYRGDRQAYWHFGVASGSHAVREGQLKTMFQRGEYRRFMMMAPSIWRGYFDQGELTVAPHPPSHTDLRITRVTPHHVYFEYSVMGFVVGGLGALGLGDFKPEILRGFSKGDDEVLYRVPVA